MRLTGISFGTTKLAEIDSLFKKLGKDIHWYNSSIDTEENIKSNESSVIIISALLAESDEEIYTVCRNLLNNNSNLAIILIAEENKIDIRKAMRSGIFDVLTFPLIEYQVVETIKEAEKHLSYQKQSITKLAEQAPAVKNARVVTVCSTKGGVGKTTFTVNLAAALAKQFKKIAVIDLDLQFGDISMFFDCNPKKTIYEWVKEGKNDLQETVKAFMYSYNEYIDIMPAPVRPEFSEAILEEHIGQLITSLKPCYDLVLIDTAPFMEDKILTALEKSDDIFLLTFLDLPTLKNSKIFIETLTSLTLSQKVKIILNRDSKKKGLNSSTAEQILGMPIFSKIPDVEKVVAVSVNEGNPYVYSSPRAKISKIIYSLALELSGKPQKQQKKSLFGRKVPQAGRTV